MAALFSISPITHPTPHLPLRTLHRPRRSPPAASSTSSLSTSPSTNFSNPFPHSLIRLNAASTTLFRYTEVPRLQRSESLVVRLGKNRAALDEDAATTRDLSSEAGVVAEASPRRWSKRDVAGFVIISGMHVLSLFAPFNFSWSAVWVAVELYAVTWLLGVSLSFHRNLSHRSYKIPKWLEYTFAYFGVLAFQGDPITWVSTHRHLHELGDSESSDPHGPTHGFWFYYFTLLLDKNRLAEKGGGLNNVTDLQEEPFYMFIQKSYMAHQLALGALLYGVGGFPFLAWGMGVRTVMGYHTVWLINAVCHTWGKQPWNTGNQSRNNWWISLLFFGDGWNNNHNAFPYSARHGLEWWQVDTAWYTIRLLEAAGLATDIKLPSEAHKQQFTTLEAAD